MFLGGLLLQEVEGLLGSEGVGGLLGVFGNLQLGADGDVAAVGADVEGVGACLGEPLAACLVETCQVAHGDSHRERLTLAWLQLTRLGEGLQLLSGLLELALGGCYIDLSHFFAADLTGILHRNANLDGILTLGLDDGLGELEGGVAEAEAEGVGYLTIEGVEVTIADVDVLVVVGVGVARDRHLAAVHLLEAVEVDVAWEILR